MEEHWITRKERESVEAVTALIALPIDHNNEMDWDEAFDPWRLFPLLYGSYSSEFDECAIAVLNDLSANEFNREDLAAQMLREMLCNLDLCDYGTSPRVCFPTQAFKEVLPQLSAKWCEYYESKWGAKFEPAA